VRATREQLLAKFETLSTRKTTSRSLSCEYAHAHAQINTRTHAHAHARTYTFAGLPSKQSVLWTQSP